MSHTQNLAQGLGLNPLSSSLLSNLNQPQQHHVHSIQAQSQPQPPPQQQQQHHISIPQVPQSQHTHSNGSNTGNTSLIQTSSTNNTNHSHNLTNNNSNGSNAINNNNSLSLSNGNPSKTPPVTPAKKKKKKKPPKEKKPRPKPGEIRLTTALDGSTLYGCPGVHILKNVWIQVFFTNYTQFILLCNEIQCVLPLSRVSYGLSRYLFLTLTEIFFFMNFNGISERGLLEEHLVGHNLERRYFF